MFKKAQIAVLESGDIPKEQKLEILKVLMDEESIQKLVEERKESEVAENE